MTPPPAFSQAATSAVITPTRLALPVATAGPALQGITVRLLRWLFDETAYRRRRAIVDLLLLSLASAAALLAAPPVRDVPALRLLDLVFPFVALALLTIRPSPDDRMCGSGLDPLLHVFGVVSVASMVTIALGAAAEAPRPLGLCLRLWLFSAVYLGGGRLTLRWIRASARSAGLLETPTLIVGAGRVATRIAQRLAGTPSLGLRPVGLLDADPLPAAGAAARPPVLGGAADLAHAIETTGARQVILAFSSEPDSVLIGVVRTCERLGVRVALVPRLFESVNERAHLDHLGGMPILSLAGTDPRSWRFTVKHGADRLLAALALLAAAPLMLAIACVVRKSSAGPILFRQRRVGRDGQVFDLLKFRTMEVTPPAQVGFALAAGLAPGGVEGADRRTWIGAFLRASSLDELPQLINVLRGEMSLVGPRPERPEFVERFLLDVDRYAERHQVKSGMTGWAQVNGLRGQTSITDRVEWDNHYIANWSLRFDLKILLLTVAEVCRFRDRQPARVPAHGSTRRD